MYKLKTKFKGNIISKGGFFYDLDSIKPERVEELGLQKYFTKSTKKENDKKTKKHNKE